jgi:asparagine synthase (glutamine-hydrolysing)
MPGFTLIYKHSGLTESVKTRAEKLVKASFKIDFIIKTKNLIILFRDGNHYPYEIIEREDFIAIVEGRIYDIDNLKDKQFTNALTGIYKNGNLASSDLEYIHDLDGEFIIYMLDKKGENHFVINDYLGRLPVYIYNDRLFIVTRDIYILDKITTGLIYEEEAVYQFLRIGYPLGDRTLFQDVKRLPPASLLNLNKAKVKLENNALDLSALEASNTVNSPEEELYEVFRQALDRRLRREEKVVLSMSGGLDSRLIMGEIVKNKYQVDFATFNYDNTIIGNDVAVVKQLARHYIKSPQLIELQEWMPELTDELITLKGGMNYAGMSFILDFLKQMAAKYGLMLTGDGGDKTLPGLFPMKKITSNGLAGYILKSNTYTTARDTDNYVIFGVAEYEKNLKEYINSMPGKNTGLKYKHFLIYERALNWLFEGEDRNRNYIWSTTPFYHPKFFRLVHSIPEKYKKNFNLFRKFSNRVDPQLNKINNANWGFPLGELRKVDQMLWRQKLKSQMPFNLKRKGQNLAFHEQLAWNVFELMHKGYGGQLLLNANKNDLMTSSTETLFHLLTLLKVSEMTWKTI